MFLLLPSPNGRFIALGLPHVFFPEGDESGKNIRILIGFPRVLKPQHGWFTSLPSNIAKVVGLLVLQFWIHLMGIWDA